MTTQLTPPRTRHLGALGLALSALLSPSGKIISSATAATVLVGGLVTQVLPLAPTPPAVQASTSTPAGPTYLAHSGSFAPVLTYIEVDEQTLPVVLTENPTGGNTSVGHGLASASPFLELSGAGGHMLGMGSPRIGPRHGSPALPSPRSGAPAQVVSSPSNPMAGNPPPSTYRRPPAPLAPPRTYETPSCTPASSAPDSESPNASPPEARPCPTNLAGPNDSTDPTNPSEAGAPTPPPQGEPRNEPLTSSPGKVPDLPEEVAHPGPTNLAGSNPVGLTDPSEAGAPTPPLQDEPQNELIEPFPGNVPDLFEAPELQLPPGTDDPFIPLIPLAAQPESLPTTPNDGQLPSQSTGLTPAAVPEPSTIGLILLGLAGLAWTGHRSRLAPTRRA